MLVGKKRAGEQDHYTALRSVEPLVLMKERGGLATKPSRDEKRRRLEGAELGVGVREAIRVDIAMGKKETRFGVVSVGTPYWEWAVPAGGVLCWIWGSALDECYRARFGKDMWRAETTSFDTMAPVDVVLFDGPGPHPAQAVWRFDRASLNTIVWFDRNRRCKPPCVVVVDSPSIVNWSVEQIALRHAELGGVTSTSTYFSVARRGEEVAVVKTAGS